MIHWIIEKSQGFINAGLLRISKSVRAYLYLISSLQVSARSNITGNTASALTTQKGFLNNFENILNRRVDIREDIKTVNILELAKISHKVVLKPTITLKNLEQKPTNNTQTVTQEEKVAFILFLAGGFAIWNVLQ